MKLLLFDLDGTLLDNDKHISKRTLEVLNVCRANGVLIGVSTSRSEQNSLTFLSELNPDILISSGGALVKKGDEYIYTAEISAEETGKMIETARKICGADCEITKSGITKEGAIKVICSACGLTLADIIAFGDDFADIGMLKLCGVGVAMGNAIEEVKEVADIVIGKNDEEGIAEYLENEILKRH